MILRTTSNCRKAACFIASIAVVAGCSGDNSGSLKNKDEASSSPSSCFNRVEGPGDLKVTESEFSVVESADDPGDHYVFYVIEVTNTSKTDTALIASFVATFLDENGNELTEAESPSDIGHVEYIPPGGVKYGVTTKLFDAHLFEDGSKLPTDMKVELAPKKSGIAGGDSTIWWPDSKVEYPKKLEATSARWEADEHGYVQINLSVDNGTGLTLSEPQGTVVIRDDDGNLLGGFDGRYEEEPSNGVPKIKPGKNNGALMLAAQTRVPDEVGRSDVLFDTSPRWGELNEKCSYLDTRAE